MPGEKNDNPSDNKEEVDNTENYDELDQILDDDKGDGGEKGGDGSSEKNEDKNKKGEGEETQPFNKKVGNREFTSEEDYDAFVLRVNNINSSLSGEVKKLGGDPTKIVKNVEAGKVEDEKESKEKTDKNEAPEKKAPKQPTDEEIYYRTEKIRFTKQFSEAKEYAEEMALSLRTGKANINGEPSFALALARSLRADNKPIPEKLLQRIRDEKGEDTEKPAAKKVMRSGGSNSAAPQSGEQHTYNDDEAAEVSDFGDKVALGQVGPY
jgi:hypothetical protein